MSVRHLWAAVGKLAVLPLLGAGALAGCGGDDTGPGGADGRRTCPTGGDPQEPIAVWPGPKPFTESTTPTELEVCLNQDIDRLSLRAQVLGANEQPMTSCITHELLRIGRNPAGWALGTLRAFPLVYAEQLPLGNYVERVSTVVAGAGYDYLRPALHSRFFRVGANGVEPITSTLYSRSPGRPEASALTPERCPDLPRGGESPNDQVPADETISVVNLDDWLDVATIQPLRHEIVDSDEPLIKSSRLTFSAWNAEGRRLVVQTSYTPESGVPFEAPLGGLTHYGADGINWYARSGNIRIEEVGEGELRVELSDITLQKSGTIDEPEVLRTLSEGSITGAVRRECRAPSPESVDSTWSAPYCARLREIGGF